MLTKMLTPGWLIVLILTRIAAESLSVSPTPLWYLHDPRRAVGREVRYP